MTWVPSRRGLFGSKYTENIGCSVNGNQNGGKVASWRVYFHFFAFGVVMVSAYIDILVSDSELYTCPACEESLPKTLQSDVLFAAFPLSDAAATNILFLSLCHFAPERSPKGETLCIVIRCLLRPIGLLILYINSYTNTRGSNTGDIFPYRS